MTSPSSHKTVFVLDHTLSHSSEVKLDMESFCKIRGNQSVSQVSYIPLAPVVKSIWTCAVEAITEYCRIVWDIFPGTRLLRFVSVDKTLQRLLTWNTEEQSLTQFMNALNLLGPAKSDCKCDLLGGIKCALECLTEPSAAQHAKWTSFSDGASNVVNKGRVIIVTKVDTDHDVRHIKSSFKELLIQVNKVAAATDNQMPIMNCELVVVNFWPENVMWSMQDGSSTDLSAWYSFELFNISCGATLAPRICSLVLKHYDLASTTVTGIPMKEEQNASCSANYDVELFHPAAAHTAILKGIPTETAHLKTIREGTDYETVTLKWCTPRSAASHELHHCSSAYRITSVDVNSRPSSCLTNFLINGRWVMLEMPKKSGSKVISHMLACHGGDIYIHTLYIARSILEDPPSISEGCGGRITDYRIPDFGELIRANMLVPHPDGLIEEGEDCFLPIENSICQLERHTKVWPITLSSTYLFNLGSQVEPLVNIMVKDCIYDDDIAKCQSVILHLLSMESKGEPLISPSVVQRSKGQKKEDQYAALWLELENFIKTHQYSSSHDKVLKYFLTCISKESSEVNGEDKMDTDESLEEPDGPGYSCERERSETAHDLTYGLKSTSDALESKHRRTYSASSSTAGQVKGTNLLTLWQHKLSSEQSSQCLEFQGRLKGENNVTKLYVNMQQKEKDDNSRKK